MIKQPEETSASLATNLTADGGIIKIPLQQPTNKSEINWKRGANAKFHFSVYAYITPTEVKSKDTEIDHGEEHPNHGCGDGCNHEHNHKSNKMKDKIANLKTIMDAIKDKSMLLVYECRNSQTFSKARTPVN